MYDDLLVRHRDKRLAVIDVSLRRALLTQIELRALRQGKARFPLARADAHRLGRIERIGPGHQLAAAGNDVNAELHAGKRLRFHRLIALRVQRQSCHAQRVGAALRLYGHRRNVDQIADPLFLRLCRRAGDQQRRAQRRAHPLMRHDCYLLRKNEPPAAGRAVVRCMTDASCLPAPDFSCCHAP